MKLRKTVCLLLFFSKRRLSTTKPYAVLRHLYHPVSHIEHVASIDITAPSGTTNKRAGIICTIGPSSREVKVLVEMMRKGMNIARLNCSHGTTEFHIQSIKNIREAERQRNEEMKRKIPVAIALDTKGPEIRTGLIQGDEKKEIELETGKEVTVTINSEHAKNVNTSFIYVDYKNMPKIVARDSYIYLDDGLISLKVLKVEGPNIKCYIENGGTLGSRKGVNLPGTKIDLPSMSEKDVQDIKMAMDQKLDMIFASFVRDRRGIEEMRKLIDTGDVLKNMSIVSKIENLQGLENLDEIIEASDGLMVARGDLGIELPAEKVFLAQKAMIAKCNLAGKPIICATQMLESMISKPRPTRAETSDVANAILDGADCVMLSGETAKGRFPVECVKVMSKICMEAEAVVPYRQLFVDLSATIPQPIPINMSTVIAGVSAAEKSLATAILVITTTGYTAFLLSRFRPPCPIIAITTRPVIARKCSLYRGIIPALHEKPRLKEWARDIESRIETGLFYGFENKVIKEGDKVIFITGWKKGRGSTNTIRIMKITKEKLIFSDND